MAKQIQFYLTKEQATSIVEEPGRSNKALGGVVDNDAQMVGIMLGNTKILQISFDTFCEIDGQTPDFEQFTISPDGRYLNFGKYKIEVEELL